MGRADFDFDDGGTEAQEIAGTPEGDGDFETDSLPETGETSAGGQISPKEDGEADGLAGRTEPTGLLEKVIDEISHGTLLP